MRIERVDCELLRLPLPRPMLSGSSGGAGGKPVTHVWMPVVFIETAGGAEGIGWAWSLLGGATAVRRVLEDDIAPLLIGEDALDHERLWNRLYRRLQSVGRRGIATQAQAAVDLALWDIKGKVAGLPVHKLLGGCRPAAPLYGSDGGWLYMSVDEMVAEFEEYLDDGMFGVKMKIGHEDPAVDVARVREVRRALGDTAWIAVDANQHFDYPGALKIGRALEEFGVAWFEEPMLCEDVAAHARLAGALDLPVALGETLGSRYEFDAYLRADAVDIVQPDVIRAGGITETLKIIALAEVTGRPVALHHMMEASVHVACGALMNGPIEYMPWLAAAFDDFVRIENGMIVAPLTPGLGLDITDEVLDRYRVQ